jgi:hypothetical protein
MRTNLNVPFEQKDEAKRAGARWDAARKVWYVENLENLEPLLKWMPAHLLKPCAAPIKKHGKNRRK